MHIIVEITLSTHISRPKKKKQLRYVLQLLDYLSLMRHFLGLGPKYLTVLLAMLQIIKGNSLVLFLGLIYPKIIKYFSFISANIIGNRKALKIITLFSFTK